MAPSIMDEGPIRRKMTEIQGMPQYQVASLLSSDGKYEDWNTLDAMIPRVFLSPFFRWAPAPMLLDPAWPGSRHGLRVTEKTQSY